MFASDLGRSQIEYLSNAIEFNREDCAKRYHKSSIFNFGLSGLGSHSFFIIVDLHGLGYDSFTRSGVRSVLLTLALQAVFPDKQRVLE
ncbi:hypothetical protein D1AOALGA4SA_2416 [Olavius algarvensis Delta 1 endosymbiont]|nr:hypothetical protein D1AOALGA4SA_2416 [Olavius algarvensis Delta 1 endosymbiont]